MLAYDDSSPIVAAIRCYSHQGHDLLYVPALDLFSHASARYDIAIVSMHLPYWPCEHLAILGRMEEADGRVDGADL